jgi:hypothetical protein
MWRGSRTRRPRLAWVPSEAVTSSQDQRSSLSMRGTVLAAVLVVAACGSSPAPTAQSSPSATISSSPVSSSPAAAPRLSPQGFGLAANVSAECRAINPAHELALVWMDPATTNGMLFVRDMANVAHPENVCGLDVRSRVSVPRFLTATTLTVPAPDGLYELDLSSGKSRLLAAWTIRPSMECCPGLTEYDVAADAMSVAYVVVEEIPTTHPTSTTWVTNATFHIASAGSDRVLGAVTVDRGIGLGEDRVEFSPSGKYVALGLTGSSGDGTMAAVQVRALDGQLVFASAGTAALTWAGSGDHLFYDSGAGIRRWDGGQTSTEVLPETWVLPNASSDRRYIAYVGAHLSSLLTSEHTAILNVATGTSSDIPGPSHGPVFLTPNLIFHYRTLADGGTDFWVYNMADGTDTPTSVFVVFSAWPRGAPDWGFG